MAELLHGKRVLSLTPQEYRTVLLALRYTQAECLRGNISENCRHILNDIEARSSNGRFK